LNIINIHFNIMKSLLYIQLAFLAKIISANNMNSSVQELKAQNQSKTEVSSLNSTHLLN